MTAQAARSYRRAGVLGALSGVLLVFGLGGSDAHWRPVERPLDLTRPNSIDASFEPRVGASYDVGIEVIRSATSSCLLGIRRVSTAPACAAQDPLHVEWRLLADGQVVRQGSTDEGPGGSWGGGVMEAALLARLPPDDFNSIYIIEVVVRSASSGLADLNPRLVVDLGPSERSRELFRRAAALLVGLAAGLLAVAAWVRTFWLNRRAS